MPRIDPLQLLRCLSVLLSPTGGIKSTAEVQRLASLMTKFSKKLVSKCIYIQILKQTQTDLLKMFMTLGGWNLIHTWLSDAVIAKNWPLIEQLLELLLMCPVDVELLKTNSCPKLVKGLSKESTNDSVKQLACKLVEQWLRMVKGGAVSVTAQPVPAVPVPAVPVPAASTTASTGSDVPPSPAQVTEPKPEAASLAAPTAPIASEAEPAEVAAEPVAEVDEPPTELAEEELEPATITQDADADSVESDKTVEEKSEPQDEEDVEVPSPVECKEEIEEPQDSKEKEDAVTEVLKQEVDDNVDADVKKEETGTSDDSGEDAGTSEGPVGQLPVYKITIRDGKQVLAKVHCGEKPQKAAPADVQEEEELQQKPEVKQNAIVALKKIDVQVDVTESVPKKKSEKARSPRAQKSAIKVERSESVSSDDSFKPSKSHKRSKVQKKSAKDLKKSKTKDVKAKDISPKGKLSRKEKLEEKFKAKEKERRKEKEKNDLKYSSGSDLDEKDKALLAKLIPPAISKLGKIPKKKKPDEPEKVDTNKPEEGKKSDVKKPEEVKKWDAKKFEEGKKGDSKKPEEGKKVDGKKPEEVKKGDVKKPEDAKKVPEKKSPLPPPPPPSEMKKVASMSIENKKVSRPKTVKTYHSKFRSTGLEEELKSPVPRTVVAAKKPVLLPEKKLPVKPLLPVKRPSPTRDTLPAEKKLKMDIAPEKEKVGGAKLIPPRPKPAFLQESDMFMDALTASSKKEPRKRKRRASSSGKDGPEAKKDLAIKDEDSAKDSTPPGSPSGEEGFKSPSSIKPAFKFYQDTLEVEDDKDAEIKEGKGDQESSESGDSEENNKSQESMDADEGAEDGDISLVRDDTVTSTSEVEGDASFKAHKGVLVYHKVAKGPKKSVRWKPEKELIEVQYFELDETERVNVTKTFTDMKQMETRHERESFLLARKLPQDDTMEEKIPWRPLVPIDLPQSVVEPGMNSREKDVQYAREKVVLRALYFNKSSIPDSPAEPDLEIHATKDPVVIPLEDASGVQESVNDFTGTPWPDPKPLLPPSPPHPMQYHKQQPLHMQQQGPQQGGALLGAGQGPMHPVPLLPQPVMSPPHQPQQQPQFQQPFMQQQQQQYVQQQQGVLFPGQGMGMPAPPIMGPMPGSGPPMMGPMGGPVPLMQQHPAMQQPAGDWRTGDGKVVTMNEMQMEMYNQTGPGPAMPMGMGTMAGMPGPDMGYNMMGGAGGGEMGAYPPQQGFPMGGAPMGGPPPPMFQQQPPQQQFPQRGNPGRRGGMRGNRRGNWPGGQNWQGNRGGRGGGGGGGGNWGSGNVRTAVCKHFRSGYCRTGDECPFLHPGVNGPSY